MPDSGSDDCGSIPHGGTTKLTTIMKRILLAAAFMLAAASIKAQVPGEDTYIHHNIIGENARTEIRIPDIEGYRTLKGDFHIHTCFSDGNVWPSFRVDEAWRNGLDVIAITDHIEYRPKKEYYGKKVNLNTSYQIALEAKGNKDLIIIPGTEITRSKPFGHMNALFVSDADKAETKDQMDALEAMLKQGAYILWNHPGWPDDKCTMYPLHEELIAQGKIHGVEVFNEFESYPIAFDWMDKYGLHPFANSDIHETVEVRYKATRPITLVFAKERTLESVKEAMFAGRTLALFDGYLMGKKDYIAPLVAACLDFKVSEDKEGYAIYTITNSSDIPFSIDFSVGYHPVTVGPRQSVRLEIGDGEVLTFKNCFLSKSVFYSASIDELK